MKTKASIWEKITALLAVSCCTLNAQLHPIEIPRPLPRPLVRIYTPPVHIYSSPNPPVCGGGGPGGDPPRSPVEVVAGAALALEEKDRQIQEVVDKADEDVKKAAHLYGNYRTINLIVVAPTDELARKTVENIEEQCLDQIRKRINDDIENFQRHLAWDFNQAKERERGLEAARQHSLYVNNLYRAASEEARRHLNQTTSQEASAPTATISLPSSGTSTHSTSITLHTGLARRQLVATSNDSTWKIVNNEQH